ncbi:unnamed protein product [Hermetia illucens]|uniref:Uncharacterized protein n=1 Tax=Hermetia illucens TaxID=343691 RepID=A0A7R8YMI3_HERIL|nr:unnamed protein product [Hermetia illucens]
MAISAWIALLAIPLTAALISVVYFCYIKIWRWRFREAYRNHRNRRSRQNSSTIYTVPVGIIDDESSIGSQKAYGNPRRYPERPPTYDDAVRAEQS